MNNLITRRFFKQLLFVALLCLVSLIHAESGAANEVPVEASKEIVEDGVKSVQAADIQGDIQGDNQGDIQGDVEGDVEGDDGDMDDDIDHVELLTEMGLPAEVIANLSQEEIELLIAEFYEEVMLQEQQYEDGLDDPTDEDLDDDLDDDVEMTAAVGEDGSVGATSITQPESEPATDTAAADAATETAADTEETKTTDKAE